jgi:cell wall-associated NlpC family hydrolase
MPATTPLPGDFTVIPISGPVGTLISIGEFLDGSGFGDYDHAEIYMGNGQTMGAYPGGAAFVPLPQDQSGWLWSTGHVTLTDQERIRVVAYAAACKGVPYSALDYFAIAAHRLHIPAPLLKDYVASTEHMICSQLVDFCYMKAGVHLFNDGRWPGYVTPANLAAVINNNGAGIVRSGS